MICLAPVQRLDANWEYHRKIVKILSEYILAKVNLYELMNSFHIDFKRHLDEALLKFPNYQSKVPCNIDINHIIIWTQKITELMLWI